MTFGPAPCISVKLFGMFELRRNGESVTAAELGGRKPRHILEILLLNLGAPVSKDCLIETLWGRKATGGAVATLESYISGIRRAIQPGHTKTGPLRTANGGYLLDPELVELDVFRFGKLLRAAHECSPANAYPLLQEAIALSGDPLLGLELGAEWAEEARSRHSGDRLAALVLAAETAIILGRPEDAIRWAQSAITVEPLNERAWTALVTSYEGAGLPAEGLAAYDRCRRIFDRDLGCAPGPSLQAAHLRLLRQQAGDCTELSEVLAALLFLSERLNGSPRASVGEASRAHENAGRVLDSFLQRVRESV